MGQVANRRVPPKSLGEIDYELYASGERNLAWLDLSGTLSPRSGQPDYGASEVLRALLGEFSARLSSASLPVGHLKVIVRDPHGRGGKLSLTGADPVLPDEIDAALSRQLPQELTYPLELLLNARVMCDAESLRQQFREATSATEKTFDVALAIDREDAFLPGYPKPVHRL
jgi:hypothetical protein